MDLQYFEGRWALGREILDFKYSHNYQAKGIAVFESDGSDLIYSEKGKLKKDSLDNDFYQAYRFQLSSDGAIHVLFQDGRPFYKLTHWGEQITHYCGNDYYCGELTHLNENAWSQSWNVKGPKKEYLIRTSYLRH